MSTNNMKCTWPTRKLCNLYSIGSSLGFTLGVMQILAFLDTNMLVSQTRNSRVSIDPQRENFASQWNIGFKVRQQSSTSDSPELDYLSHSLLELQPQYIKEEPGIFSIFAY